MLPSGRLPPVGESDERHARDGVGSDFQIGEPSREDAAARIPVGVPDDLKYVRGHFPGDPIVPGVAQLLLAERGARRVWPELGAPTGIRRLKFSSAIRPGDSLELRLERKGDRVRFAIHRDETECSRGSLRFDGHHPVVQW